MRVEGGDADVLVGAAIAQSRASLGSVRQKIRPAHGFPVVGNDEAVAILHYTCGSRGGSRGSTNPP